MKPRSYKEGQFDDLARTLAKMMILIKRDDIPIMFFDECVFNHKTEKDLYYSGSTKGVLKRQGSDPSLRMFLICSFKGIEAIQIFDGKTNKEDILEFLVTYMRKYHKDNKNRWMTKPILY